MKESMNYKTFTESFAYYNRTAMQGFFEQKALEGWVLCKKESFNRWIFKRIAPKKLHYAITYLPQFSNEDSFMLSENKNEYLELCAGQGWQFACVYKNMVVFFSEEDNPLPLETDPDVELASIHKSMLKRCLPKCAVSMAVSAAMIFILLFTDVSSNIYSVGLAVLLLFPLISAMEFIAYLRWSKKALAAAATGEFSRTDKADKFIVAVVIAVFVIAVAVIIVKSAVNNAWATLMYFVLLGAYCLFIRFIEKLKKRYNSGWKSIIIKIVQAVAFIAVIDCGSYIYDMF